MKPNDRMKLEDQIDEVLSELPRWTPPPHFARRVAMAAQWPHRPVRVRSHPLFWIGAALQGAAVALVAYVGSSVISSAAIALALTLGTMLQSYARSLSALTP